MVEGGGGAYTDLAVLEQTLKDILGYDGTLDGDYGLMLFYLSRV